MQILAEQGNDVQAGLAMFAKKAQQVFALDQGNLRIIQELGRHFISASGQRSTQT
jgi:hypothetical protein